MLLIRNPNVWEKVKGDTDTYLEPFLEEVLRIRVAGPVPAARDLGGRGDARRHDPVRARSSACASPRPTVTSDAREPWDFDLARKQSPLIWPSASHASLPGSTLRAARAVLRFQGSVRAH